jgi:hypothetical protein
LLHSGTASLVLAALALVALGPSAVPRVPFAFLVAAFADWRGGDVSRGGWRGFLVGAATLAIPLQWLRPCCAPGMEMDASCCQPGLCLGAGAAIGLCAALLLPRLHGPRRWEATAAMVATVIAVATTRCAPLFLGESIGLLGGIALGLVATSGARALWDHMARA